MCDVWFYCPNSCGSDRRRRPMERLGGGVIGQIEVRRVEVTEGACRGNATWNKFRQSKALRVEPRPHSNGKSACPHLLVVKGLTSIRDHTAQGVPT
jgi:hypothetical protein